MLGSNVGTSIAPPEGSHIGNRWGLICLENIYFLRKSLKIPVITGVITKYCMFGLYSARKGGAYVHTEDP